VRITIIGAGCLIALLVAGFTQAATIHVDDDNTSGPWLGTEDHPYQYIQDGINAASGRDTVIVRNGTYRGSGNVNLDFGGKAITVKSMITAENCIIDCRNTMYVRGFLFQSGETLASVVDGFTIQNGAHDLGGAIHCKSASSPTIKNCIIEGNEAVRGGGISCLNGSNPEIVDNRIRYNAADWGGGIYCSNASPTIETNDISYNDAEEGGGVYYIAGSGGSTTLNVIMWNTAVYNGGGVYCDASSPTIQQNNISENSGDWQGGGIACVNGAFPIIDKNAVNNNVDATWGGGIYCYKSGPKITENTIYNNTGGSGGGGIHITECTSASLLVKGNWIHSNTAGDGAGINCYASTGLVIEQNDFDGNTANNNGGGIWCYKGSTPDIINNTIKAGTAAENGAGIYCSSSSPLISGNTIENNTATKKGGGIYCLKSSPDITGNSIITNGADHGAGIFCYSSSAPEIKGNTIQDNAAIQAAGGIQCNSSNPHIDSNLIKGNSCAAYGGSTIVCVQSSPDITNNLIVGNSDNAFEGGTIYCGASSSPTIMSNTIVGNSVKWGGSGIYCTGSSVTVKNTILWNNSSPEIYFDDFGPPSFISIANSDVKGGQLNGIDMNNNGSMAWFFSNIDADPAFVDEVNGNYHLALGSPCIGAGAMLIGTPSTDMEDNPRPNPTGSNPDIGAYESPLSGLPGISISPVSWHYDSVAVGSHSDKTFVVTNIGSGTLDVTSVSLTNETDFSIQNGVTSFTLEPGNTQNIIIRFAPASEGAKTSTLELINNVAGSSPLTASLQGNGASAPEPDIEVSPPSWDYGEVALGSHADKIFIVSNPGSGTLNVSAPNISGHSDFSIEAGGGIFSLNPGETREILVRFTPASASARTATLNLPNDATSTPVEVGLDGLGVTIATPDIEVSPMSWNYGDVEIGLHSDHLFAVFNTGSGLLEVYTTDLTGHPDFQIGDGQGPFSLPPGGMWEILVRFTPSSDGTRSAGLSITNNVDGSSPLVVELEGTGISTSAADIVVEPEAWDYGELGVGLQSVRSFTVFNPGSETLEVYATNLVDDTEFHICDGWGPFTLAPGNEHQILVVFAPTSPGHVSDMLVIESNVPWKNPLERHVSGTGVSDPEPDILVDPFGWDFGEVPVGGESSRGFIISNFGSDVLEVTEISMTNDNDFDIGEAGEGFELPPGEQRELPVIFAPTSGGEKYTELSFVNNVPGKNPLSMELIGFGIAPPPSAIELGPGEWNYGEVPVGTHRSKEFLVFNTGEGILEVTEIGLEGDEVFFIDLGATPFALEPGGMAEIVVRFSPQSEGARSATLILVNNTPESNPLEIPLEGSGILGSDPDIVVEPASWDYGSVPVGYQLGQGFAVFNPGTGMLEVAAADLTGSSDFSIVEGGGSFSLAPGEERLIVVLFTPTSLGVRSATLSLENNVDGKNPIEIQLQGEGVEPGDVVIVLEADWNLISIPVDPPNPDPDVVLSTIEGMYDSILAFDPDEGWSAYSPEASSTLDRIESGRGYWIKMHRSGVLMVQGTEPDPIAIPLDGGKWNLVGYNSRDEKSAEEAMESVENSIDSVWGYSPTTGWSVYTPGGPGNLEIMYPGRGYWIRAYESCSWNINN
jgi:parallel beta-helix repeat protein/predicted outer membrane repeat protein